MPPPSHGDFCHREGERRLPSNEGTPSGKIDPVECARGACAKALLFSSSQLFGVSLRPPSWPLVIAKERPQPPLWGRKGGRGRQPRPSNSCWQKGNHSPPLSLFLSLALTHHTSAIAVNGALLVHSSIRIWARFQRKLVAFGGDRCPMGGARVKASRDWCRCLPLGVPPHPSPFS